MRDRQDSDAFRLSEFRQRRQKAANIRIVVTVSLAVIGADWIDDDESSAPNVDKFCAKLLKIGAQIEYAFAVYSFDKRINNANAAPIGASCHQTRHDGIAWRILRRQEN